MTPSPSDVPDIAISREMPDRWNELLAATRVATFFHRPEWITTYAAHHQGEPRYLYALEGSELVGGLPCVRFRRGPVHFYESLPLGTYGGPVTRPGPFRGPLDRALMRRLVSLGDHPLCVRVQCVMRRSVPDVALEGFAGSPLHLIPIGESFESFWRETFPRNRRNECTRAAKRGVTVDTNVTHDDIESYYPLDVEAHRRWGLRPHPKAFFHGLVELESPHVHIFVVRAEGRLIGLHVCFESSNELVIWHGVTDREGSKRYFPTSMLARAEAELAAAHGLRALNMGASGGRAGISNYKKLLGGALTETPHFEWNHPLVPLVRRLWRRG